MEDQSSSYHGSSFADVCNHAHYTLYNRAYFVSLSFGDSIACLQKFPAIIIGEKCNWEERTQYVLNWINNGCQGWCLGCLGTTLGSKEDHRFSMKDLAKRLSRHLPQAKKTSIYHEPASKM